MTLAFGGDPTPLGWTITAAYALVAWLCWRARGSGQRAPRVLWIALGVGLALLCVNKQLDLQTELTAWMRGIARRQGWYAQRRGVQIAGVAVALGLVALGSLLAVRGLRGHLGRLWPAIAGVAVLGAYIALRMTSLHEVDGFMVGGAFPAKWWAELVGLALIAWGATRSRT